MSVSAVVAVSIFLITYVAIGMEKINRTIVSMSGERAIGSPRSGN
jgi:hypothetical protein